jgi:hypothetical protein
MSESPSTAKEYYALCVKWEDRDEIEVAPLHLGENEYGTVLGFAVYTSAAGALQGEDLAMYEGDTYKGDTMIRKVSHQELLDAVRRIVPNSVFIDGQKVAGSVFTAMLMDALGIPIRQPRHLRPDPAPE